MTEHTTVAIIGGGVAGLTLANALEQAGIAYILWEGHDQIAPPAGASLGLMPNGLRILDQLGVVDEVEKQIYTERKVTDEWYRLGYGGFFLERQCFLEILYQNIKDKTRIHTKKKVVRVQSLDAKAIVTAADGSQISCDVVAGADGVKSAVRAEMEAMSLASGGGGVSRDSNFLSTKYACVYGISSPLPAIKPGKAFTIYRKDVSLLIVTGIGGVIYWFVFQDLKASIPFGQTPRYTQADVEALCGIVADTIVTDGVRFADIFKNRTTAVMTALQEGVVDTWFAGRLVLLGDSGHKMVPHAAMGANLAMESAACLVNRLLELRERHPSLQQQHIPLDTLQSSLREYSRNRTARAADVVRLANSACCAQLKAGPAEEAYICNILPTLTNEAWLARALGSLCKAEKLENWHRQSDRVAFYTRQAERIRQRMEMERLEREKENGLGQ
ncbi:Monooxygenase [Rasamsonia emersonii CBS 393.64]|uniref:Monooxygenase n=1 Tax=Rasamsonia emersonii (strain ATCC 16479 / CBS 393.64 / IMI 116815) TaxID=1408163 RepID=A0A0F4YWW5_RASE3|nr:Monooxygenase [Rasamsonia emersonii CBS 393.64]KKA22709.1 Monooxygenase [Rasamsonia emersonii CBS 393.64]